MGKDKEGKPKVAVRKVRNRAADAASTLEWLITAFALAFVFRAFVMEAFRIPTGSMADTLLGANYRLRCTQCGYKYYYGHSTYNQPKERAQERFARREYARCPSCGYLQEVGPPESASGGDRILV
jgi:signal peptidase I